MAERPTEGRVDYVLARVGGANYQVELPMTRQTIDALHQAQSGREARATNQMRFVPAPRTETVK